MTSPYTKNPMRDRLTDIYDRLLERYGPRDLVACKLPLRGDGRRGSRSKHRLEQRREGDSRPL